MKSNPRDRFRTIVDITESASKISYDTPVMLAGSCFSNEIANKMKEGKMEVLSNPFGTVYNPFSTAATIRALIDGKHYTSDDLYLHNGIYLSFDHYTTFSSDNKETVLEAINQKAGEATEFLSRTGHLFITFGTARIYRRRDNNNVVSNCHKIPSSFFRSELLTPAEIVKEWSELLDILHKSIPGIKVWFTVSPVRHWKDGAHGNQISKSVLHISIEELLSHKAVAGYFPSYELVMDDLRDYRFYAEDMLHPSSAAVDYIWERFSEAFLTAGSLEKWEEVSSLLRAIRHRPQGRSGSALKAFSTGMINKLDALGKKYPDLSFVEEADYFKSII